MSVRICQQEQDCLSIRLLPNGDSALVTLKLVFIPAHMLINVSFANSHLFSLRNFCGSPYTLTHIWNISYTVIYRFWMVSQLMWKMKDLLNEGLCTFHKTKIHRNTRRATQSLLKIRKSYKRFLKQRSKAFETRRRRAGGGAGGLVSPGGG